MAHPPCFLGGPLLRGRANLATTTWLSKLILTRPSAKEAKRKAANSAREDDMAGPLRGNA
eukprot:12032911-Alexandrium_andersonii.AAC.1